MIKKISLLLALCLICSAALISYKKEDESENKQEPAQTNDKIDEKEEDMKKSIDVYLIAGQSNAVGYTVYNEKQLASLWDKYNVGEQSVLYFGRSETTLNVNTPQVSTGVNEFRTFVPARAGMGASNKHIGPEVGMAAYLSQNYYNEQSGKQAAFIKLAHGGTSLLNSTGGENAASGNWVSPSYARALNIKYEGLTGGLYRALLSQVEQGILELKLNGYEVIDLKGMFWMQGESDVWNPDEYVKSFKYFASDLRNDLTKITGKDQSAFPIMIGEISKTSGSAASAQVAKNQKFINKQWDIAIEVENVHMIASGQFEINRLVNGQDVNDQDAWHWNTEQMFSIGKLVGECIVKNILKK